MYFYAAEAFAETGIAPFEFLTDSLQLSEHSVKLLVRDNRGLLAGTSLIFEHLGKIRQPDAFIRQIDLKYLDALFDGAKSLVFWTHQPIFPEQFFHEGNGDILYQEIDDQQRRPKRPGHSSILRYGTAPEFHWTIPIYNCWNAEGVGGDPTFAFAEMSK